MLCYVMSCYMVRNGTQYGPPTPEYLGDERATVLENVGGDVERGQQQLRLHVLVNIVHASHVRRYS
jgi:hypothetical protein